MPKLAPQIGLAFWRDCQRLAGVDEAGRGPLAGPVTAAAVILAPGTHIDGLTDSKLLSAASRAELEQEIQARALAWCVGRAEVEEIDRLNILQATFLAMRRAVAGLSLAPEFVVVDGNRCPQLDYPVEPVVGGDRLVACISAASILAKEARDRELCELDRRYPGYGFAKHKGYGTAEHLDALRRLGPSPIHRRSFRPVKELICGERP